MPWPLGIDDGTDDDNIRYPTEEKEVEEKALRFDFRNRQWTPNTWPVHHTWDEDWTRAQYHNIIDDGTDDNEVVDVMNEQDLY